MGVDVSIIIVNYKSSALINDCIRSIFEKTEGISYEIIVVDNATEDLSHVLDSFGDERVKTLQLKENVGFGRANNAGAKLARGRNFFLLNPDTILRNNAVKILSDYLDEHPEAGACGGNLFDENINPVHSYRRILPGFFWDLNELSGGRIERWRFGESNLQFNNSSVPLEVGYVTGADLMLRRVEFNELGGFDPDFFMYYEETDLEKRLKYFFKKKVVNVPAAKIIHLVGGTLGTKLYNISKRRFWEVGRRLYMVKHHGTIYNWASNVLLRLHFKRNSRIGSREHKEYYDQSLMIHKEEWQRKWLRVVMEPCPTREDGSFLDRFCQALRKVGDVEIVGRLAPRNAFNVLRSDWIILNWWEDEYFRRSKLKRVIALWLLRFSRAKKAVVFHNKQPHESTPEKKVYYKKLLEGADRVVLLTESSRKNLALIIGEEEAQRKGVVVHHPNYDVKPKIWGEKPDGRFKVLFFGLLRPYKNLELLVEIAKKHPGFDFMIAGDAMGHEEYVETLIAKCKGFANLKLDVRFLSDEDLDELIDEAHILCLPYNTASSQNSGVALYAFSKNINVVIPKIETIKELKNCDCVYSYSYEDCKEHVTKLEDSILAAWEDYYENYGLFVNRTELLHKEIINDYSLRNISNELMNLCGQDGRND